MSVPELFHSMRMKCGRCRFLFEWTGGETGYRCARKKEQVRDAPTEWPYMPLHGYCDSFEDGAVKPDQYDFEGIIPDGQSVIFCCCGEPILVRNPPSGMFFEEGDNLTLTVSACPICGRGERTLHEERLEEVRRLSQAIDERALMVP